MEQQTASTSKVDLNPPNPQPKTIQMKPQTDKNFPADAHHQLKSFISIIFVTVFLLGGFVAAFLLKDYLLY